MQTASELRQEILREYIKKLQGEVASNTNILNDKNWASDGSDYHKECRVRLRAENDFLRQQINLLRK